MANEDEIDELHFIRRVVCYYLTKAAGKKSSSSLVYARKKSWKRSAAVSEEIRTSFQHFPEKSTPKKDAEFVRRLLVQNAKFVTLDSAWNLVSSNIIPRLIRLFLFLSYYTYFIRFYCDKKRALIYPTVFNSDPT